MALTDIKIRNAKPGERLLGERNLIYVRGGYANTRAELTREVNDVAISDRSSLDCWFVGGGVERKLLDDVSTRVDYRYSDLSDHDYAGKSERHQEHKLVQDCGDAVGKRITP